eukprot:6057263-Pleurochrysis_carterae.AAC.1
MPSSHEQAACVGVLTGSFGFAGRRTFWKQRLIPDCRSRSRRASSRRRKQCTRREKKSKGASKPTFSLAEMAARARVHSRSRDEFKLELVPRLRSCCASRRRGNKNVILCERGSFFGYHDMVVDPRNLIWMRSDDRRAAGGT